MIILLFFLWSVLLRVSEAKYVQYYTDGVYVFVQSDSYFRKMYVMNGVCISGDIVKIFGLIDSFKLEVDQNNVVMNYFCDGSCTYCQHTSFAFSDCGAPDRAVTADDFSSKCTIPGSGRSFLFGDSQMKVKDDEFGVTFFGDGKCGESEFVIYYNTSQTSDCFVDGTTGARYLSRPYNDKQYEVLYFNETCTGDYKKLETFDRNDNLCFPFASPFSLKFDYYYDVACEDGKVNGDETVCNNHGVCMVDNKCECYSKYKTYSKSRVCVSEEDDAIIHDIIIPVTSTTAVTIVICILCCLCYFPSCFFVIISLIFSAFPTFSLLEQFTTSGISSFTRKDNNDENLTKSNESTNRESVDRNSAEGNNNNLIFDFDENEERRISAKKPLLGYSSAFRYDEKSIMEGRKKDSAEIIIRKELFKIEWKDLRTGRKLGSGGSGALVVKGEYNGIDVAIKIFNTNYLSSSPEEHFFGEFEREVELLSGLRHPNIIMFYGASVDPPRVAYVTEYCSQSVYGLIDEANNETRYDDNDEDVSIQWKEKIRINVGTSYYMAPEIIKGEEYGRACDVYSLSIVMWELFYEKLQPYSSSKLKSARLIEARVAEDPSFRPLVEMDQVREGRSWYVRIMRKCWSADPEERPKIQRLKKLFTKKYSKQ